MFKLKKIAGFSIGPLGSALLGFLSVPLIAHYFSAEVIGSINMLNTFTVMAIVIFAFGLDHAYLREYHDESDKASLFIALFLSSLIASIVTFALISGSILSLSNILFGKQTESLDWMIRIFFLLV